MTPQEAINEALYLSGVTAAELARRLGLQSRGEVDRWRYGTTKPRPSSIFRVFAVLGLDGDLTASGWSVRRPE